MDSVHEGHRERLRRRFLREGLRNMEPHTVLELLLTYSIPRRDTNAVAHALLRRFGSFDKVLEADAASLADVDGVGESSAVLLRLIAECFAYYEAQKHRKGFVATDSAAAIRYAQSLFVGENEERIYLLCFDARLKLINCTEIARGTVGAAQISARRVVETAALAKATAVILTHNHPNGVAMPSADDLAATKALLKTLASIGIDLADHIIVGERSALSLADSGVLHNMKQEVAAGG